MYNTQICKVTLFWQIFKVDLFWQIFKVDLFWQIIKPQKMISPQTFCVAFFPLQNCEFFDTISKAYCSCLASSKCNSVTSEFCVQRPSTIGTLPCIDHRPSELYRASTIDHRVSKNVHRTSNFQVPYFFGLRRTVPKWNHVRKVGPLPIGFGGV